MAIAIIPGMKVIAYSSYNGDLERRALTGVVEGQDFPVVWVCKEVEWSEARDQGPDSPDAVPWPAEDVRPAD
jgi:hypothetical protein